MSYQNIFRVIITVIIFLIMIRVLPILAQEAMPETLDRNVTSEAEEWPWPPFLYVNINLFRMNPDRSIVQLTHFDPGSDTEPVRDVTLSPDGQKIVLMSQIENTHEKGTYTLNVDGSNLTRVDTGDIYASDFAWSPDSTRLVFIGSPYDSSTGFRNWDILNLYMMNADGSKMKRIGPTSLNLQATPIWLPDGQRILFEARPQSDENDEPINVYLINLDGSNLVCLTCNMGSHNIKVSLAPTGTHFLFTTHRLGGRPSGKLYIQAIDSDARPVDLTSSIDVSSLEYSGEAKWSPDGQQVAFNLSKIDDQGNSSKKIYFNNIDGTALRELPTLTNPRVLGWSPNGQQIAFEETVRHDKISAYYVGVINVDGTNPVRVTSNNIADGSTFDFTWLPDNNHLLLFRFKNNYSRKFLAHFELFLVQTDGENLSRIKEASNHMLFAGWLNE